MTEVHVKDREENKSVFVVLHGLPNGAPRISRLGVVDVHVGMQELKLNKASVFFCKLWLYSVQCRQN